MSEHHDMVEGQGKARSAIDLAEIGKATSGELGRRGREGDPQTKNSYADDALARLEQVRLVMRRTTVSHVEVGLAPPSPPKRCKVAEEGGNVAEAFERNSIAVGIEAGGEEQVEEKIAVARSVGSCVRA